MRVFIAAALAALTFSSSAPAQTVPVRVGVIPVLGAAQLYVLDGEGWAKSAGLALETKTFESGPNMIQALASGTLDVYVAGLAPLIVARGRGVDVRVVASTAVAEMEVAVAPKLARHFAEGVTAAQALRRFREAEGRPAKFATQPLGSGPNTSLQHWLWKVSKVDRADVQVIEMGIDATQRALLTEAVDGASIREPALTLAKRRNAAIKVVASGPQMLENMPGVVVAVSGAFADKNPKAVRDLVGLLHRATATLQSDPDRAAPFVAEGLGRGLVPVDVVAEAIRSFKDRFSTDPRAIVEPTNALQAYQVELGAVSGSSTIDGLFDPKPFVEAAGPR